MTIDLGLSTSTGDLVVNNFDLTLVDSTDQIAQNLAIRLRFFLAEWFLDIESGIPYYQDILIKAPNQFRVESVIKEEIINTDGIVEILSFSTNFNERDRKFTVSFSCDSVSGVINLELELL